MYALFLFVHSLLRWIVLILGLVAVVRAIGGVSGRRPWVPADDAGVSRFARAFDVQVLIGLIGYFFASPFTMEAWRDIGATMQNGPLRFIVVEHTFGMIVAIALTHIGRARIRKAAHPAAKHRAAAIFLGLALLVILLSIPWPFMPAGRPYFRGFSTTA
jgi:hypothetical protein